MDSLGDRRAQNRYEVVEPLFGTLDVVQPARVINISATGALILAMQPVAVGALQSVLFTIDGKPLKVPVVVRRVERAESNGCPHFYVGVEFLSAANPVTEALGVVDARVKEVT